MSDKSLETVIFSCKTSSAALIPYVLWGFAGFLILAVSGVWQLGAAVCGALIIYGFTAVSSGGLTVTDCCVRNEKISVPLCAVRSAVCEQGVAGKLLGYGTIVIYTTQKRLTFRGIARAEALKDIISKQVDLYHFKQTCRQAEQARMEMTSEQCEH